ncbi:hypothetical protein EUTSA_v10017803mg [Eutrema salsugineum]|uniref:DUF4408 domain-containing protein n=1 Tax=Eutrema salsugineum TaxID=72664 RepID=V4LNE5_EUTSA|nr:hypothetical protein EUTSA_v10017803mg [Eutrema salsugineum]
MIGHYFPQTPSYIVETPNFEPNKPKKQQYNIYTSLLPILLSISTYILIFYVLDVSPSSIFNDTKILFLISNALILIIAADYGAFTEKENHDFYGEYRAAMRSDVRENPRPKNSGYEVSLTEEIKKRERQEKPVIAKEMRRGLLHKEAEVPEKTVHVVSEKQPRKIAIQKYEPTTDQITASNGETCNARKLVSPKPYGRSKSDKARTERRRYREIKHRPKSYDRSQSDSSKWMVVHKGKNKAEEAEEKWENVREESEEFAKMSNEELNRRVEDFIQRFNRDIKRQSVV